MSQIPKATIREILLETIKAEPNGDQSVILSSAEKKLRIVCFPNSQKDSNSIPVQRLGKEQELALLTEWNELFRTGILSWGLNLCNPNPPWFHLTDRGEQALEKLARDPSNPAGYIRHINSIAAPYPIAWSYLTEALECYVAGLFKASAVMLGAAAENLIIELADITKGKLNALGKPVPKNLSDWKVKTQLDALCNVLDAYKSQFPKELRESYEAYWTGFAYQIRVTRNDAGHPADVEPVTSDTVHASLLIFPELARVVGRLADWVLHEMK